jgi:DNA-binding NarL/FixJ family response regulator
VTGSAMKDAMKGAMNSATTGAGGAPTIRVLIVDDHPVVRDGLRGVIEGEPGMAVVGEAGTGAEALARVVGAQADGTGVDVVLMDLRMPEMGGVEAIKELRRRAPEVRVLVLTTFDTDRDVLPAVEAGATGYLLKDTPRADLLRAVRAAHRGEAVLSPAVAGRLMGQVRGPEPEVLSARELEVLTLVAAGSTNRDAAQKLFISEATVKTHLLHIYAKLDVRDRASAVAAGYQRGLLTTGRR